MILKILIELFKKYDFFFVCRFVKSIIELDSLVSSEASYLYQLQNVFTQMFMTKVNNI